MCFVVHHGYWHQSYLPLLVICVVLKCILVTDICPDHHIRYPRNAEIPFSSNPIFMCMVKHFQMIQMLLTWGVLAGCWNGRAVPKNYVLCNGLLSEQYRPRQLIVIVLAWYMHDGVDWHLKGSAHILKKKRYLAPKTTVLALTVSMGWHFSICTMCIFIFPQFFNILIF